MILGDLLLASAGAAIAMQRAEGSFPPGHNGPYRDKETPVRNTAHWLLVLCKAYLLTGGERYRSAGMAALSYLLSSAARPMSSTFYCRTNPRKDFANGLIGQAWVVESLVEASEVFEAPEALDLAFTIISLHPFDERRKLWWRVNVDGSWLGIDNTFNHQLWFGAAAALALGKRDEPDVRRNLTTFFDWVSNDGLRISRSGRVIHRIPHPSRIVGGVRAAKRMRDPVGLWREKRSMAHKEAGYHAFNLYAFSMLRPLFAEHPFWNSPRFEKALRYLDSGRYQEALIENKYGYPYNPPGLEVAFTVSQFPERWSQCQDTLRYWLAQQFSRCWDANEKMLTRGTLDPTTAAARIYEASRLPSLDVDVEVA